MVLLDHREHYKDPTNNICAPAPPAPRPVCLIAANNLSFPFGNIDELQPDDLRATAYEIFFTACRSSPGFGSRGAAIDQKSRSPRSPGSPRSPRSPRSPCSPHSPRSPRNGVGMVVTSRVKKALGLKMSNRTPARRCKSFNMNTLSPSGYNSSPMSPRERFVTLPSRSTIRRPLTSAEIMRQQMKVSEDNDIRLRKTLVRTLVGQSGRRTNTIILPLELLRHLNASEFDDVNEYHAWQKRQLKTLEVGLLNHPSIPLEKGDNFAKCILDIINSSNLKPIDTNKNSETMKILSDCVVSLSWRSSDGGPTDVCHWADGYPLNVNLYLPLLQSIFDLKEETSVLDDVDELLELMKKTWSTLGITRPIHNLCFTWVLFQQFIMTGQVENELLRASLTMLNEVANDAKKVDRDPIYVNMLLEMLNSMIKWSENHLLNYHKSFRGTTGLMENILPLVFSATKILENFGIKKYKDTFNSTENEVNRYIRSSLRNVFAKMEENMSTVNGSTKLLKESEKLLQLAKHTEELGLREKMTFSPILKKWNMFSAGVAAVTLHTCYGNLLRQFLVANPIISNETVDVLQRADKLEKVLVNMVVEDSIECEDGGKTVVRDMVPYDVDSIVSGYLRQWIQDCLKRVKDVVETAKETETWNPKSKSEPYAQSAMELMKQTKEAIESFFNIPIGVSVDLVCEFAGAIEHLFQDYIAFVASCGSKESYVPALPPLTRCGQGSAFNKLWQIAAPCGANPNKPESEDCNCSRPSTSRGTQRLYIRLNSLHYILSQLDSIDENLARTIALSPQNQFGGNRTHASGSYFNQTRSTIQWATKHVSEIAAYKLIYLDSNSVFYGSLYIGDVEASRITPALKIMKQNLTLLTAIVTERAQPLAIKELMKATFDAYLRILLAGGIDREFTRSDHQIIEDDFMNLKRLFSTCDEGLIVEDVVDQEAEAVEGVVALMGKSSEHLVDVFSALVCDGKACDRNGAGVISGQKLAMPPATGKWSSTQPNTIVRVLCHRNEATANLFLKKMFQLRKRK